MSVLRSGKQRLRLITVLALHRVDIALRRLFRLADHRARILTGSHLVADEVPLLLLGLRRTRCTASLAVSLTFATVSFTASTTLLTFSFCTVECSSLFALFRERAGFGRATVSDRLYSCAATGQDVDDDQDERDKE